VSSPVGVSALFKHYHPKLSRSSVCIMEYCLLIPQDLIAARFARKTSSSLYTRPQGMRNGQHPCIMLFADYSSDKQHKPTNKVCQLAVAPVTCMHDKIDTVPKDLDAIAPVPHIMQHVVKLVIGLNTAISDSRDSDSRDNQFNISPTIQDFQQGS